MTTLTASLARRGRCLPLLAIMLLALPACAADGPIEYTVALPAPQTQMVEMSIVVPEVDGETVEFILPVWRPGRYAVLDPAGTVREVRASDAATGEGLPVEKVRKNAWSVRTQGAKSVRLDYRVYANSLADRTRHVDDTHAFLSPSSVFVYVPQRRDDPLVVRVQAPEDWDIATGLESDPNDPRSLIAPDYDVLVDSPLEIGVHRRLTFDVDGVPHEIILWGDEDIEYDEQKLTDDFAAIVRVQRDIFGAFPYERYVFITHVGMGGGGGTEHLNSTVMQTSRRSFEDDGAYDRFLGLVAHEFFHTWNVKQFRPAGINPYDYERENYTKLLWVAEGTTSYYDDLTLVRTGHTKPAKYLQSMGDAIDALRRRPGRLVQSVEESSFDAWIKFSKSTPDDVNSSISFYTSGAMASLALDWSIRKRSGGAADLDDVMRTLYERFPLSGGGYTPEDLLAVINEISGSDFGAFFARHIRGTEDFDFESLADACGLELVFEPAKREDDGSTSRTGEEAGPEDQDETAEETSTPSSGEIPLKAYLGLNISGTRVSSLLADSPAYASGLLVGDELVAVNGKRIGSQGDLDDQVNALDPGQSIHITFFRRDHLREVDIALTGVPDGSWTLRKVEEPTDEQKAQYADWLGQEW
ncbi:MAG: M61 family metallopeptidase [Phycisphaerales bacterium]|nr:M61 family metallopeptidase [Phycisphaerales bacterium]